MNYAAHIFEPFSRLENKEKYEGNGVGLATVKNMRTFTGTGQYSGFSGKRL